MGTEIILPYPQDEVRRIEKALLAYMTKDTWTDWRTKEKVERDCVWNWERWAGLSDMTEERRPFIEVPNLGTVRVLSTFDNNPDSESSSPLQIVFHITEPNGNQIYLRKDGFYQSHDGTYWDGGFYQVHPVPVTFTDYQKVR